MDRTAWPKAKEVLAARFKTKTQTEWLAIFEGVDACVSPVLTWADAASHPHVSARKTLVDVEGVVQPAPAPRFSRTPLPPIRPPLPLDPASEAATLADWLDESEIAALRAAGTLASDAAGEMA
jgi:crotonobetainyl-CoA:carnitine CoA-transferase CaiB-like acyl-CoA transferase